MKIELKKLDKAERKLRLACSSKNVGAYKFAPCPCGCTSSYGFGMMLYWFIIIVHYKEEK